MNEGFGRRNGLGRSRDKSKLAKGAILSWHIIHDLPS